MVVKLLAQSVFINETLFLITRLVLKRLNTFFCKQNEVNIGLNQLTKRYPNNCSSLSGFIKLVIHQVNQSAFLNLSVSVFT